MKNRKIIHVDMDCFYAAVEMRDDPKLKNIPIAIGGPAESRSVLCTCNYPARKFGLHAGMASAQAKKLCPQVIMIPPNFKKYKAESEIIHEVFREYTELIEPLSLDEAYLDVTDSENCQGSATLMAEEIRAKIFKRTGLTASAGVAPNKFLAKVASEKNKPNGTFVVTPDEVADFVPDLALKEINGVGKVSAQKLANMGLKTCLDVQKKGEEWMNHHLGKFGAHLFQLAHGNDDREVVTEWERKSLSSEHTYAKDIYHLSELFDKLTPLLEELNERIKKFKEKKKPDVHIVNAFVKVKFNNFQSCTAEKKREVSFFLPLWEEHIIEEELFDHMQILLKMAYDRYKLPVRLMGVGVRFEASTDSPIQLSLKL